jgi:hypothetical protein
VEVVDAAAEGTIEGAASMMTVRVVVEVRPDWSVGSVAGRGLHALRRRRKVGSDGADAVFQVSAFEGFVVDAIVNASDLAFDGRARRRES